MDRFTQRPLQADQKLWKAVRRKILLLLLENQKSEESPKKVKKIKGWRPKGNGKQEEERLNNHPTGDQR